MTHKYLLLTLLAIYSFPNIKLVAMEEWLGQFNNFKNNLGNNTAQQKAESISKLISDGMQLAKNKNNFRKIALNAHPDKNKNFPSAAEIFTAINSTANDKPRTPTEGDQKTIKIINKTCKIKTETDFFNNYQDQIIYYAYFYTLPETKHSIIDNLIKSSFQTISKMTPIWLKTNELQRSIENYNNLTEYCKDLEVFLADYKSHNNDLKKQKKALYKETKNKATQYLKEVNHD